MLASFGCAPDRHEHSLQARLDELRARTTEHTARRLFALVDDATDTLGCVIDDESAPAVAEVSACRVVLTQVLRHHEAGELESRLGEVERLLARRPTSGRL